MTGYQRGVTLIAEDVLLLLLDDTGAFVSGSNKQPALAGAVLAELALLGAVEIETGGGLWKKTRVAVQGEASDPLLAEAIAAIGEKPRSPQDLVNRLGRDLPDRLCERLVARGLLRREQHKLMGLFPRTRWQAADARHEQALRAAVQRILVEGQKPDERVATVIAVLSAADVLTKVIDRGPLSNKELKRRAEDIAAGGWATEAVRKALQAANQAAMVAAVAATTAAVAGSS